jgi:hypothetical protein
MCFPFDDAARGQGYDWFIDKEQQRYVTIGLPPEIDDENYFVEGSNNGEDQDHISVTIESSLYPTRRTATMRVWSSLRGI